MSDARTQQVSFLVIGAGFSGLGAAIRLTEAGHRDLVVLERASDVGGTWRDNVYPGCRCDVPSNL
jgi:cation diffusion facilitator CzcD-associated flavoprotein CzcO